MQTAIDSDEEVVATLRRSMSERGIGNDPLREIDANYERLSQFEKTVLLQLHNWSQDNHLRKTDAVFAAYNTRRLRTLLEMMKEAA